MKKLGFVRTENVRGKLYGMSGKGEDSAGNFVRIYSGEMCRVWLTDRY